MAEEQLESLNTYMAQASVSYQKEIVRLRAVIGQVGCGCLAAPLWAECMQMCIAVSTSAWWRLFVVRPVSDAT